MKNIGKELIRYLKRAHFFQIYYTRKRISKQFIHDLNDSELMNLGLNSIQSLLSKDWNSSEDDVFNDI